MDRRILLLTSLALGVGCKSDYNIKSEGTRAQEPLSLEVTSPTYGVFLGESAARVEGTVTPTNAVLEVEGERVYPNPDGSFSVDVPVDYAYRNIDVHAAIGTEEASHRVPVFSGDDPSLTWPDGVALRLLPAGMQRLGGFVGSIIDGTGWADQLSALLPSYEGDLFQIRSQGITHDPTIVDLESLDGEIGTKVALSNIKLAYTAGVDAFGIATELSIAFSEIGIDATLEPWIDGDGVLWLGLQNPSLTLGEADIQLGPLDGWLTELIIDWVNDFVLEPIADLLLGFVIDQFGELEVGGPLEGELDLLGTPLSYALADLYQEDLGLGVDLGIGIGNPAPQDSLGIAVPDESTPGTEAADAAVSLHEGILQVAIGDLLFDLIDNELDAVLGIAGPLLGNLVTGLPGGDQAPEDAQWCFEFEPGDAYVARMHEGTEPLGSIYLPDFVITAGTEQGAVCSTWLSVSMATEVDLVVTDGSKLGFDISMPEGAVLEYDAVGVNHDEVVAAFGSGLAGTLSPLLGSFSIDLADILGGLGGSEGPLGDIASNLDIEIQDSRRFTEGPGAEDPSLYAVSIGLFAD